MSRRRPLQAGDRPSAHLEDGVADPRLRRPRQIFQFAIDNDIDQVAATFAGADFGGRGLSNGLEGREQPAVPSGLPGFQNCSKPGAIRGLETMRPS